MKSTLIGALALASLALAACGGGGSGSSTAPTVSAVAANPPDPTSASLSFVSTKAYPQASSQACVPGALQLESANGDPIAASLSLSTHWATTIFVVNGCNTMVGDSYTATSSNPTVVSIQLALPYAGVGINTGTLTGGSTLTITDTTTNAAVSVKVSV